MVMIMRKEINVASKIYELLKSFVNKKFHGVTITKVELEYKVGLESRKPDIAVLKDDETPLIIIETKKEYERRDSYKNTRFNVMSEEVLGQVFSYAAILKKGNIYVPFVATANDRQIAVFKVPEDIDKRVNWEAIRNRKYGKVLTVNQIYELRENYLLKHRRIKFTEDFFAEILDILCGIYAKEYRFEDKKQELHWVLIEDLRGFVDTLTPFVLDAIAPNNVFRQDIAEQVEEYARQKGYRPTPEQLAREMAYVLMNKIIFYKVLERHYNLEKLTPLYSEGKVDTVNKYLKRLRELFNKAVEITKDFEPVFYTGIYDHIDIVESEEVLKLFDWLINLIDHYNIERFGDIIGYVYEDLIPAEERHQLGQFYTPKPIAELIVKWAIRSENDRVLDAGCGSGTFLIEGYKRLLDLKFNKNYNDGGYPVCTKESNEHQEVLNQLYGVDINAFATHITSIHLMLMEPKCPISKLNIETRDFFTLRKYENAFGETLEGFDAVIGNPPYTRWVEIPEETKDLIKRQLDEELKRYDLVADVARGKEPGIYIYWIMHAAKNLLKERGRIGMIISNAWLQTDYGVNFGKFLLDNFRIVALIDLSFRLFEAIISTVIILAEKEPDKNVRNNNIVTLIRIPPKIKGVELDLDKTGKILDDALRCVEDAINKDGSIDVTSLERCQKEYGIYFTQVKQSEIPREDKWIKLFFVKVEEIGRASCRERV